MGQLLLFLYLIIRKIILYSAYRHACRKSRLDALRNILKYKTILWIHTKTSGCLLINKRIRLAFYHIFTCHDHSKIMLNILGMQGCHGKLPCIAGCNCHGQFFPFNE